MLWGPLHTDPLAQLSFDLSWSLAWVASTIRPIWVIEQDALASASVWDSTLIKKKERGLLVPEETSQLGPPQDPWPGQMDSRPSTQASNQKSLKTVTTTCPLADGVQGGFDGHMNGELCDYLQAFSSGSVGGRICVSVV